MNNLIVKEYLGNGIEFKIEKGMVYANATSMCKAFGKEVKHWLANESTKELINEVSSEVGIPTSQLILVKKGNSSQFEQGTWIHEELILELASWLSIKFRRWCQKQIATLLREGKVESKNPISKEKRLEIMEKNANVRMSKQYLKLAELTNDPRYKEVLIALGANTMSNKEILPLPKLEQKSYTAEELGEILGLSKNMVGRIANANGLKTTKNGYLAQDKSPYSNKSVEAFRYYECAIEEFKKVLNGGN